MDIDAATAAIDQVAPPHGHRKTDHPIDLVEMPKAVLTRKQAAAVLSVSVRTLERLVKNGDLLAYRIGQNGPRRFRREDVERALIPDQTPDHAIDGLGNFISNTIKKEG